jgi:hypothetical protein
MTWIVVWTDEAEGDLTRLWLDSRLRYLITTAANQIDYMLSVNPAEVGESREGNKRIAFVQGLGIDFQVVAEERTVFVLGVWSID